jgi:protein O-mannosyl-transferase
MMNSINLNKITILNKSNIRNTILWTFLLTVICYTNSIFNKFTLDSSIVVLGDTRIREFNLSNLKLILEQNYWFPFTISDLYRPFTTLTYLVNYSILGNQGNPAFYHIFNTLIHWVNGILVFIIAYKIINKYYYSLFISLIFIVHPVLVEAVSNIVGRADLLATFFLLICLNIYINNNKLKYIWSTYYIFIIMSILGLLSKETGILLIGCMFLYDFTIRYKFNTNGKVIDYIVSFIKSSNFKWYIGLLPSYIIFFYLKAHNSANLTVAGQYFCDNPIVGLNIFNGFMTSLQVILRQLWIIFIPLTLSCDYSYNQIPLYGESLWWQDLLAWIALSVVIYLIWSALVNLKNNPRFSFGILWFFICILPTSNIIFKIGSIMADRFLYLPIIGILISTGALISNFEDRIIKINSVIINIILKYAVCFLIIILALFTLRTITRNEDWRDDLSLWKSAVTASPNSFKVYKGYASSLYASTTHNEDTVDTALALSKVGLSIMENNNLPLINQTPTILDTVGQFYIAKGDLLKNRGSSEANRYYYNAAKELEKSVQISNLVKDARLKKLQNEKSTVQENSEPISLKNLLSCYLKLSAWPQVKQAALLTMKYEPSEPGVYNAVGVADANLNEIDAAAAYFVASLLLKSDSEETFNNIKFAFKEMKLPSTSFTLNRKSPNFDVNIPKVRITINTAFLILYSNYVNSGQPLLADNIKKNAINNFLVPKSVFDKLIN